MKGHKSNQRQLVASVSLKQEKGYLTALNLSDILKELFSLYYKEYLYRAIFAELNNKTDPENIICFEWSLFPDQFMANKLVKDYEEIPIDENTVQFFYLCGSPHGLLPGKQIEDLREIFSVYNSLFPSKRRSNMDDGYILREAYRCYKEKGVRDSILLMIKHAKNIANRHEQRLKNIERIFQKHTEWYKSVWEKNIFESSKNALNSGAIGCKELIRDQLYDSYYAPAFRYLVINKIPAVAIFNPQKRTMRFLAKEVLCNPNNPYFFDLKSYTHESPSMMDILANAEIWLSVIGVLFAVGKGIYTIHEKYKDKKNQLVFDDIITFDKDITQEERKAIRYYYTQLEQGNHLDFLINIIENVFCKKELKKSHNLIFENSKKMLESFNLVINTKRKIKVLVKKSNTEK